MSTSTLFWFMGERSRGTRTFPKDSTPTVKETPPIVQTPEVLGGKPRIQGRRIAVQHIVVWHNQMGMSEAEIAREFDLNSLQIRAALAYYNNHREEIDGAIQADEKIAPEMQQRYPSKLEEKLRARRGE